MNNAELKRLEDEHPPNKRIKLSNGATINLYDSSTASVSILPKHSRVSADFNFQDQACSVDVPFHVVRECDLSHISELQVGTKISPSDTIETNDGFFLKIKRISQDELGTIKLYGDVFISEDQAYGLLPEMRDEVYWLCHTIRSTEETCFEEKWVSVQHVKQLRELTMITHESPAFGRNGERPTFTISNLPTLICRWRYVVVGEATDLSTERCIQALTTSMINTTAERRVQNLVGCHQIQTGNRNKRKRSPETSPPITEHVQAQGMSASFVPGSPGVPTSSDTDFDASDMDSDAGRTSGGSQDVGSHIYWEDED